MPKTSEMRTSKYLQKSDVGTGVLLTVTGCSKQNVALEDDPDDFKWTLSFKETSKPLVLNSTNIELAEKIFASDDTDRWIGQRIVLYTDPNVSFKGKLIGGIRVRAPRIPAPGNPASAPAPVPVTPAPTALPAEPAGAYDDEVPFAWLLPLVLPLTGVLALWS